MRASQDLDAWNRLCDLTFKSSWLYDAETVEEVQQLPKRFGGNTTKYNTGKNRKYDVVVVFDGKETIYDTVAQASRHIPVSAVTIHKHIHSGKTMANGYSFYLQNRHLMEVNHEN